MGQINIHSFTFDFSKAFDMVSHNLACSKLKKRPLNPYVQYVVNCIIDFLSNRSKRVVVDGQVASFLPITRGVPQGTVLGTYLFSMMVNDIKTVSPSTSIIIKFADDLTLSVLNWSMQTPISPVLK